MSAALWITTILSIIFSIIAAYIAITFILPMIKSLVKEIIDEPSAVGGFMSILVIVVYILLFKKVIEILSIEENKVLSYLAVLDPGIKILDSLLHYIGWVLLGALIAFGLGHYLKKKPKKYEKSLIKKK